MTSSLPAELSRDLDAAFPALVEAYGSMVATMSARLTDPRTGEDITQEVFLRAYRALTGYGPERISGLDLRPWLATITRNLVRNEYRRKARRAAGPGPLDVGSGSDTIDGALRRQGADRLSDDPAGRADVDDEIARLDELLGHLTDPQREAVVLRHIAGLSVRDIAVALDCPEGTVKSHVSRGMAALRNALAADLTADRAGSPRTEDA